MKIEGKSIQGIGAYIFNSDHQINRINITGNSTEGEGLRVSGHVTILNSTLSGVSMNGRGVKIDSEFNTNSITLTTLDNSTLDGSTTNGKGVEITSDIKGVHQNRINGTTDGTGVGIDIAQNLHVTGTSQADLLTLQGAALAEAGTGIRLHGNNDLSNTSLSGITVMGTALKIIGPVTNKEKGKAIFSGTASESGTGVEVSGMLADIVLSGDSANGTGVRVSGETTLANTTLTGNSADGAGVNLSGNNTLDNVSLAGEATNGTGMNISGPMINHGNTAVNGKSAEGDGVRLNGAVTGGTVNGSSANGSGVNVTGDTVLDNSTLNGSSAEGTGLDIHANITGSHGSGVQGNTANGTGVAVGNEIELTGAQTTDLLRVSGNASGERGTGVKLNGNNTLDNVSLAGKATDGHGVDIPDGPVTNKGNTTIEGSATDRGHGVHVNAVLMGGEINGSSGNNAGILLNNHAVINEIAILGNTTTHPTAVRIAAPAFIGNNVVINGHLIERSDPRRNIDSAQNSGHQPSTSREITAQSNGQAWVIPFSLLRKRDQILSTLEGHHFPLSSQLTAYQLSSGQESVGNVSFNVCVPARTTSEITRCDEHVFGKWIPLSSTRRQE